MNGDQELYRALNTYYSLKSEYEDNVDKYTEIIKNSPYDKSANLIKRPCNKCTRTYMTHIHVSKHQTSIYTCICGNYISIEH